MEPLLQAEYYFAAPAAVIKDYIQTPERIMDYFPLAIRAYPQGTGVFVILSWAGATLLETSSRSLESDADKGGFIVEMRVHSALVFTPPFTAERIKRKAFFSMRETWTLSPEAQGCRLLKTWGDVTQHHLRFLPITRQIVNTAKKEGKALVDGWNRAYQKSP